MLKIKEIMILSLCVICSIAAAASAASPTVKVSFKTDDGIVIAGVYAPPAAGKATYILLHGLGSNKEEWEPLEKKLSEAGLGYLAFDARGHGESVFDSSGKPLSYQSFGRPGPGSPWSRMTGDLGAAVKFLQRGKMAGKDRIGLVGASLGANVCLIYAAGDRQISSITALSAGMDYAGYEPAGRMSALASRRVLFAASPVDRYAYKSSEILYRLLLEQGGKPEFYTGESGHGVQMFDERFMDRLIRWLAGT